MKEAGLAYPGKGRGPKGTTSAYPRPHAPPPPHTTSLTALHHPSIASDALFAPPPATPIGEMFFGKGRGVDWSESTKLREDVKGDEDGGGSVGTDWSGMPGTREGSEVGEEEGGVEEEEEEEEPVVVVRPTNGRGHSGVRPSFTATTAPRHVNATRKRGGDVVETLDKTWVEYWDEGRRQPFFHNLGTGETKWKRWVGDQGLRGSRGDV